MVGSLLVALGVGYWVLLLANKESGNLRFLGRALAILIIAGATLSIVCYSAHKGLKAGECKMYSQCPSMAKKQCTMRLP